MEIKLENVTIYDKYKKKVINDFSYNFNPGNIYGIIGPSGSGKSYLGKFISGLIKLDYGEITYGKLLIKSYSSKNDYEYIRNNIGFVNENSEVGLTYGTVYEELINIINEKHYRENELDNRIQDVLKIVGLDDSYINQDPTTLSTGEMSKLALAKNLIYNPKVLILDEPCIGLDDYEIKQLTKLIRMLKKRSNKTIIVITNNLEFLISIVDEVIVLKNGSIIKSGNKTDVFKDTGFLKKNGIQSPNTFLFSDIVLKKKRIKIGYREQVNDLIKDIYRYASWGCDKND